MRERFGDVYSDQADVFDAWPSLKRRLWIRAILARVLGLAMEYRCGACAIDCLPGPWSFFVVALGI